MENKTKSEPRVVEYEFDGRKIQMLDDELNPTITNIYALLCQNDKGEEGIIGSFGMPFICDRLETIEKLKPEAHAMAKAMGKKVVLAQFSTRKDLEILE